MAFDDPPAALLQPMRLAPSSHGNSAYFACLGAVFEIFGLWRNAIRQGKLLLAVTVSISGELGGQSGAMTVEEILARLVAFPTVAGHEAIVNCVGRYCQAPRAEVAIQILKVIGPTGWSQSGRARPGATFFPDTRMSCRRASRNGAEPPRAKQSLKISGARLAA